VRYGSLKDVSKAILFLFAMSGMPLLAQSEHVINIQDTRSSELSIATLKSQAMFPASIAVTSEELPDAPDANSTESDNSAGPQHSSASGNRGSWQGAPPAARGGPLGVDSRVADRHYWMLTGAMFAASIANVQATHDCLAARTCNWVPDTFTRRRNMLLVGGSADLGIAYLSYYMKKKRSALWFVPEALVTGVNAVVCIHDARRAME
jgi:hypothetical protein